MAIRWDKGQEAGHCAVSWIPTSFITTLVDRLISGPCHQDILVPTGRHAVHSGIAERLGRLDANVKRVQQFHAEVSESHRQRWQASYNQATVEAVRAPFATCSVSNWRPEQGRIRSVGRG